MLLGFNPHAPFLHVYILWDSPPWSENPAFDSVQLVWFCHALTAESCYAMRCYTRTSSSVKNLTTLFKTIQNWIMSQNNALLCTAFILFLYTSISMKTTEDCFSFAHLFEMPPAAFYFFIGMSGGVILSKMNAFTIFPTFYLKVGGFYKVGVRLFWMFFSHVNVKGMQVDSVYGVVVSFVKK